MCLCVCFFSSHKFWIPSTKLTFWTLLEFMNAFIITSALWVNSEGMWSEGFCEQTASPPLCRKMSCLKQTWVIDTQHPRPLCSFFYPRVKRSWSETRGPRVRKVSRSEWESHCVGSSLTNRSSVFSLLCVGPLTVISPAAWGGTCSVLSLLHSVCVLQHLRAECVCLMIWFSMCAHLIMGHTTMK